MDPLSLPSQLGHSLNPGKKHLKLVGSQTSAHWFHEVVWSLLDFGTATNPNGVILGGCEGGIIQVYALKLLCGENALMAQQDKHNGAVRIMDYNSYQNKLSEGTTDRHPIADPLASAVQWHPEVATQLWVTSEADQASPVQLWDLRYTPTKTFHIHQRGVLGLTWCPKNFDLVASCGKDNKIYCWNQNSEEQNGEILSELATTNQWNFDVAWCPRNPALIAGSSFDGNVTVYSINGGAHAQLQTVNKIADSFTGVYGIEHEPVHQSAGQPQPTYNDLKRPAGACFGFSGKLDTFNGMSRTVIVNQVLTDRELIECSNRLEQVLAEGTRSDTCVGRNLKDCWETSRLDCANFSDAGDI
ncbi:hypothetical protein quinque_013975 [Culex quinquefasciatus]